MKIKLLFSFILLSFSYLLTGQHVIAEYGDSLLIDSNTSMSGSLMVGQDGYYVLDLFSESQSVLGKKNGSYSIHRFGKDLQPLNSAKNIFDYRTYHTRIHYTTITASNLLIFASRNDRKKKNKQLLLYTFDPVALNQVGKEKVLINAEVDKKNNYFFRASPDKSKILIIKNNNGSGLKDINFDFIVIDHKGGLLWGDNFSMENEQKIDITLNNSVIDNNGNFILLSFKNKRNTLFLHKPDL